jgi:enoyl-CoA hydratase
MGKYPFFDIEKHPEQKTAILYFNRPEKLNAMNWPFWQDLPSIIGDIECDPEILVVVVAGRGKSFSVGIDIFEFFVKYQHVIAGTSAPLREELYSLIFKMQEGFNRMAMGEKIYIAAVHRHCIGAGLDFIAACDIRLASEDAIFSLRETKIGIVADMGSLNRLPLIIGYGNTSLMALTGRDFAAREVLKMGLLTDVYESHEQLMTKALDLAREIAANPSAAVRGTKKILNYMQDHSVDEGLNYVALWNSSFLDTQEIQEAMKYMTVKRKD